MGSLQRTDRVHATSVINPLVGFLNQTGFASFTRLGVGEYVLVCDEPIAAVEGYATAHANMPINARCDLSNSNDGTVTITVTNTAGAAFDPPALFVDVRQIATGPATPIPTGPVAPVGGVTSLYVDTVNGNDSNPGTLAAPLLTLNRAMSLIPDPVPHDFEIVSLNAAAPLVATDATFQPRTFLNTANGVACIYLRGNVYTETLAPFAADVGTGAAVVVGAGLVANAHWRQFLQPQDGAALGQIREVRNNTVTDLIPMEEFSPAPAAGDSVRIVRPACGLDLAQCSRIVGAPSNGPMQTSGYAGGLVFESLRFENGGGLPINIGGLLTFYVCDDDGTIVFLPADGEPCVFAGIDSLVFALAQAPANVRGLATGALLGAGYGSYNASGMSFLFSGYVAARSVGLFDGLKAFSFGLSLQNPPLAGSPMLAGFGGALGQFGLGNINGLIDHTTGTEQAVRCDAGAYFSIDNCEINCGGANGDGMRTYTGGTIRTGNNTGTCTRYGAYALQGGAIYIDTDDAGPQGGVANLAVGVTPDTAAAIAVVGNALLSVAQNDGSVIQRVG